MPKLMLGDNPFFAISHLAPGKSESYLKDGERWSKAADIIKAAPAMGIDSFMISTHRETKELLEAAGYADNISLPEICLVVPNVHDLNTQAASIGIVGSLKSLFGKSFSFSALRPSRLYKRLVMNDLVYSKSTYVALHNVVVDLCIGLRASLLLSVFCRVTRFCGYKPVLITMNPIQLMSLNVRCAAVCCYYNNRLYNVSDDPATVIEAFEKNERVEEIWAMGIVASGVVPYDELALDPILKRFTRILIASTRLDRIEGMSRLF